MPYFSLARRYRPQIFPDIIGQEVLVKVLSFSISNLKLASSFLFTGIRGIGKTTSARIIAQTINCTNSKQENKVVVACQKCTNCLSSQSQSHPDLLELDAASYTSVDNIRDIIEKANYLPVLGRYKVFIIDEAHMLSKNAFNALLKTLEEPPNQVIFMLLTTEPNKIPLTVASRCQKFNLRRLGIKDLTALLEKICKKESIDYEIKALELIAYKADGSARDAIVLLEQSWSLAKQNMSKIHLSLLDDVLDLSYTTYSIKFIDFIFQQNIKSALNLAQTLYERNFDFTSIVYSIIDLLGFLTKASFFPEAQAGVYSHYDNELKNLTNNSSIGFLTSLWQIFNRGSEDFASGRNHLMYFEMLLIKAMYCKIMPNPLDFLKSFKSEPKEIVKTQSVIDMQPSSVNSEVNKVSSKIDYEIDPTVDPKKNTFSTDYIKSTTSIDLVKNKPTKQDIPKTKDSSLESSSSFNSQNKEYDKKMSYIIEFIQYAYSNILFDIYHFVMNECQILEFGKNYAQFVVKNVDKELKDKLTKALIDWREGEGFQLNFLIKEKITSLNEQLKSSLSQSPQFKLVKSFFAEVLIKDIGLNSFNSNK